MNRMSDTGAMVTTVQITSCPECGWRQEQILGDGLIRMPLERCPSYRVGGEPCLTALVNEHVTYMNCLDLGHDMHPMESQPEVQKCARCGCVFQNSGGTLTLSTDTGDVAIPNSVVVDLT